MQMSMYILRPVLAGFEYRACISRYMYLYKGQTLSKRAIVSPLCCIYTVDDVMAFNSLPRPWPALLQRAFARFSVD